jgi:hypothetical protein
MKRVSTPDAGHSGLYDQTTAELVLAHLCIRDRWRCRSCCRALRTSITRRAEECLPPGTTVKTRWEQRGKGRECFQYRTVVRVDPVLLRAATPESEAMRPALRVTATLQKIHARQNCANKFRPEPLCAHNTMSLVSSKGHPRDAALLRPSHAPPPLSRSGDRSATESVLPHMRKSVRCCSPVCTTLPSLCLAERTRTRAVESTRVDF